MLSDSFKELFLDFILNDCFNNGKHKTIWFGDYKHKNIFQEDLKVLLRASLKSLSASGFILCKLYPEYAHVYALSPEELLIQKQYNQRIEDLSHIKHWTERYEGLAHLCLHLVSLFTAFIGFWFVYPYFIHWKQNEYSKQVYNLCKLGVPIVTVYNGKENNIKQHFFINDNRYSFFNTSQLTSLEYEQEMNLFVSSSIGYFYNKRIKFIREYIDNQTR